MTRTRTHLTRALLAGTTVVAVGWLGTGTAGAHISPTTAEVPAGGYTDVQLLVPHGCEGSPTTKVEVQVPAALNAASPYVNPGWTAEVTTEPLDEPITDAHGAEITERDSVITWTAEEGSALPDGYRTTFGIGFQAPDTPGERLDFPVIQTCEEGSSDWTTVFDPASGDEEPEKPAPSVAIVASEGGGHGDEADEPAADEAEGEGEGDEGATTETASGTTPASSSDDDSDGASTGLAIGGLVAGLAGLGLGGAAFAKTRKA